MTSTNYEQRRLRVFAGPNGSGKSTVIGNIRNIVINNKPIDFGLYINADDIATELRKGTFAFHKFDIVVTNKEFIDSVVNSGLINDEFPVSEFLKSYSLRKNRIAIKIPGSRERIAQMVADYLRKRFLKEKRKFTFETVFSHPSKLDILNEAKTAGYKVYLYFVSTESPEINKYRVKNRSKMGGHNSFDGINAPMFIHFKKSGTRKQWKVNDATDIPSWFFANYIPKKNNAR